jgi:hypothetical protein
MQCDSSSDNQLSRLHPWLQSLHGPDGLEYHIQSLPDCLICHMSATSTQLQVESDFTISAGLSCIWDRLSAHIAGCRDADESGEEQEYKCNGLAGASFDTSRHEFDQELEISSVSTLLIHKSSRDSNAAASYSLIYVVMRR